MISRSFLSVLSDDLPGSQAWYVDRFGYEAAFASDWFVHLRSPSNEFIEVGFINRSHEIVPDGFVALPAGAMLTIVIDDVDALHERCVSLGDYVVEAPRDLFYGQRRMVLRDPNGLLVDVSSECDPDPAWLATLS